MKYLPAIGETLAHISSQIGYPFDRFSRMNPHRAAPCVGPLYPYDPSVRSNFTDIDARIYAWPSRGGVIVLDTAEAIDFECLGLNPLDPPLERPDDQAAVDAYCQRLLSLGAKWWDSEARYSIVSAMEMGAMANERVDNAFPLDKQPPPTMREKRLIKVGWPSTGGVWVAEFDTTWAGVGEDMLVSGDEEMGRLRMARTMDERCSILRDRFEAKFYTDLKGYEGYGFFNSWDPKGTGEIGPLLQPDETRDIYWKARSSLLQNIP